VVSLDALTEQLLLGRAVRAGLSAAQRSAFANRRILITGAGGSVGSELGRQLAECGPAELVLLDHGEYALFRIARELRDRATITAVLGDVSRRVDIRGACLAHRPDYVFHAAACKHVTVAEQSIVAAARSNVLGAVLTARAAREVGARFVLISSDKAAEPRSVMGATKRMAERLVLRAGVRPGAIAVRFGNVLGSSGSVVELLLEAARAGQTLTVTDPAATRFFMTAAEAVSLVLKAAILGRAGDVFWLDMGRPVGLGQLVERIIDLVVASGRPRPPIKLVGLRPGEKCHEELTNQGLEMERTDDAAIWRARQAPIGAAGTSPLNDLRRACRAGDAAGALRAIQQAVPDYVPSYQARAAAARTRAAWRSREHTAPAASARRRLARWQKPA
jgi:FlaA1/EpsC-like NDP-sugar epimerase